MEVVIEGIDNRLKPPVGFGLKAIWNAVRRQFVLSMVQRKRYCRRCSKDGKRPTILSLIILTVSSFAGKLSQRMLVHTAMSISCTICLSRRTGATYDDH